MIKVILVSLIGIFLFAAPPKASLVEVESIKEDKIYPLEKFVGTINFSQTSKVASQSSGVVQSVNFKNGDRVKKGDILVKIDTAILNSSIEELQANIKSAKITQNSTKRDFIRYKNLLEKNSVTQKLYDDSLTAYQKATQTLKALEFNLKKLMIEKSKKVITAPFSGVVSNKYVEIGEFLNNGSVVCEIVNTDEIEAKFNVELNYIDSLNAQSKYKIIINDKEIEAKSFVIIPKGDKLTRTLPIIFRANLKEEFVFDGMEVFVFLPKHKEITSLIAPRDAVIKRFNQNVVFVDFNNTALMVPVEIVGYKENNIAIKAEKIKKGMSVVTKGNERIFPNMPIKIINKK